MQWTVSDPHIPDSLSKLSDILLANRSITDAATFFNPPLPSDIALESVEIDPSQVEWLAQRLSRAIMNHEKMLIFGDYDADGICATAIMWEGLRALGCQALPFIPHREKHGYGLSHRALDEILAVGRPDLIITVDNGIVAHEPIARLRKAGIDVVITDHHVTESTLPPANAVIHSTKLCGATVSWMIIRELMQLHPEVSYNPEISLDLAGIATIADQVPLTDANRSFAYYGLKALSQTTRVGLCALYALANVDCDRLSSYQVNYQIAPRINAMGRLEHGLDALRLLCTTDKHKAKELAQYVTNTNTRRQDLTMDMMEQAKLQASQWTNEHIIIVQSDSYHEGVIGLIAGRLTEEFYKPAIAMYVGADKVKASARSVAGVNIVELIREVRSDLLEVGGHPMAAGFGLSHDKIELVSQKLRQLAKEKIEPSLLSPQQKLDCLLPLSMVSADTYHLIQQFQPFGQGNPEPVFGWRNLTVVDAFPMGKENKHLKIIVSDANNPSGATLYAIAWNFGHLVDTIQSGSIIDLAGTLNINEWNGRREMQIMVKDIIANPKSSTFSSSG